MLNKISRKHPVASATLAITLGACLGVGESWRSDSGASTHETNIPVSPESNTADEIFVAAERRWNSVLRPICGEFNPNATRSYVGYIQKMHHYQPPGALGWILELELRVPTPDSGDKIIAIHTSHYPDNLTIGRQVKVSHQFLSYQALAIFANDGRVHQSQTWVSEIYPTSR